MRWVPIASCGSTHDHLKESLSWSGAGNLRLSNRQKSEPFSSRL